MSARDLLVDATPRPWRRNGPFIIAEPGHLIAEKRGLTSVENIHLIVAAVNEYEPLLDLEEVARATAQKHAESGECGCNVCGPLARLDAIRSGT